jgi:hypothetical protein
MFVTPVPRLGDVVVGRDAVGRVLRISAHPNSDRVVLSIWQDGCCLGTLRLASDDVPHVLQALSGAASALSQPQPHPQPSPPYPRTGEPYPPAGEPYPQAG